MAEEASGDHDALGGVHHGDQDWRFGPRNPKRGMTGSDEYEYYYNHCVRVHYSSLHE